MNQTFESTWCKKAYLVQTEQSLDLISFYYQPMNISFHTSFLCNSNKEKVMDIFGELVFNVELKQQYTIHFVERKGGSSPKKC